MKVLGLDIGSKRIGVALSDALGITAQGLENLERKDNENLLTDLKEIVKGGDVSEIVVGLPLNMDGSEGPGAKEAIAIAEVIEKGLLIPVKLWDERMSTLEVERLMIAADVSRAKRKKKVDRLAAQVILQSYLNSKKNA